MKYKASVKERKIHNVGLYRNVAFAISSRNTRTNLKYLFANFATSME